MTGILDQIRERTVSSFGVSIGTGIALETLFDPTTERYDNNRITPTRVNINEYRYHYINIFTMIRNMFSASSLLDAKPIQYNLYSNTILDVLVEELNAINMLYSNVDCDVIFLLPNYTNLIYKISQTRDIKKNNNYKENIKLLKLHSFLVYNIHKLSSVCNIRATSGYRLNFIGMEKNLITTHLGIDLCYKNIDLLESHTGVIKKESEFNSKYVKLGKNYDMSILPYDSLLLSAFGDKYLIPPMERGIRSKVYDISSNNWSLSTSSFKIENDLRKAGIRIYKLL